MTDAPASRAVSVTQGVAAAALALALALGLYADAIAGAGFPDGHLTEYQRWALPYQKAAVVGLVTLTFVCLTPIGRRSNAARQTLRAAVVATLLVALAGLVIVPKVGRDVLQLEHGRGG